MQTPREAQTLEMPLEHAPRRPLRVIVVDDDESQRSGMHKLVKELGHLCAVATTGEQALAMHEGSPADVILSDWRMPEMDGVELLARLRAQDDKHDRYTYFILVTGLHDRAHFLQGLAAGADEYITKPVDVSEVEMRLAAAQRITEAHRQLAKRNVILRRNSESSFRAARVDPLTNVANRRQMTEDLELLPARARRYGQRYSAAICDVDFFKLYNDHLGHPAGDAALRQIANAIRSELRGGDGFYRYGGEEFLVILAEQGLDDAARAVERLRAAVERIALPHESLGPGKVVTISIGVAELGRTDASAEAWIERADRALYLAKSRGRNRVEIMR